MKIFGFSKRTWVFDAAYLKESCDVVPNPRCGWYQIYPFPVEMEPDFEYLNTCIDDTETLALVILDIGAYSRSELNPDALERIRRIFDYFVAKHKDMILRIVYDHEGKGIEKEPLTRKQIEEHICSLGPLLKQYAPYIYIVQGLLVGSWGEMHTSKFLTELHLKHLYQAMLSATGEETFLAVRRPMFWRMLHGKEIYEQGRCSYRMGLFDDGMLASESHMGTFGIVPRQKAAWKDPWMTADELSFEDILCQQVPHGGEVVLGELSDGWDPEKTIGRLKRMHVSYLNKKHDERLLDQWKTQKLTENSLWGGCTLYDYVGAHLGYRFVANSAQVKFRESKNRMQIRVEMENTGFAVCYEDISCVIEIESPGGIEMVITERIAPSSWKPETISPCEIYAPLTEGKVYIRLERKKDQTPIAFAQKQDESGRVYLGEIKKG